MKYPKLPKKFKEKWLKALRSGEYEQGDLNLYLNGYYCCIGVAGHICGISNRAMKSKSLFQGVDFHSKTLKKYQKLLPDIFITLDPIAATDSLLKKFANMNDGHRESKKSFNQIADWIEENL